VSGEFDLVVRGGTIVDGTGSAPFEGDVAVANGRIAAVGEVGGTGRTEIEAHGNLVTPGFIDLHTHLDGHVTWGNRLDPCSGHGVTTAVFGNCGVGFAPARPDDHELLIQVMEGVEDIEPAVLRAGLPWAWETYPEYLDFVGSRQFDMDVAGLVPHSAVRTYVMGRRGVDGEPATESDIAEMAGIVQAAAEAGALGFGTSRIFDQVAGDGRHIPSYSSSETELQGLASGLSAAGAGVVQAAIDFNLFPAAIEDLALLVRVSRKSGRPTMFSLKQCNDTPEGWKILLEMAEQANEEGLAVLPQVLGRPTGLIVTWEGSLHPFRRAPSFAALGALAFPERIAALRTPEVRARLIEEADTSGMRRTTFKNYFLFGDPPDYEPGPELNVEVLARQRGVSSLEVIYDRMLEDDGHGQLLCCVGNFAQGSLDPALDMMRAPWSVPGLGDAGAHSTVVCDASISTYLLTYWTRDRRRGDRVGVPEAVEWLTSRSAAAIGLRDRGVVAPGMRADLNVIDYDHLALRPPHHQADLPAGGLRLLQDAEGYVATIVRGEVVRREDRPTEALPGRLVRGAQPAPVG
jgi:N-acyl-D-amino-acid deacylase